MIHIVLRAVAALRAEKRLAAALVLANALLAGAQFLEPVLYGRIIDRITVRGVVEVGWTDVIMPLLIWGGIGLFNVACGVGIACNADRLAHRRRLSLTADFFEHVLRLPTSFHGATHSGRLLKVMSEGANGLAGLWLSFFRENCASVLALGVMMPLSLVVNWRLGLLLIGLVASAAAVTILVLRRTEVLQSQVERSNSGLTERMADCLANVQVIQSFARIFTETQALRQSFDALMSAQLPVLVWWGFAAITTRAASIVTLLSILVLGLKLHFHGLASVGEIVAFMGFSTGMVMRLEQLVRFGDTLALQLPKLRDFFAVFDIVPEVRDRLTARDPGRLAGRVVFQDVSYSYDGVRDAVRGLSIEVKAGETVALVGATGSGKSTTIGLLYRAFDPTSGRVLVDGFDLREMTLSALRRNIGVVFQEPKLFARSIAENLKVGKPDATAADLNSALERAHAAAFVARQPNGLATDLGEGGRTLSGGERQRLAIARVLLKDPPILILDEATSALDAVTEQLVQNALDDVVKDRTTFIIAHRLSTIRHADRILVIQDGQIVESGSYDALVQQNGHFASLARAQGSVNGNARCIT